MAALEIKREALDDLLDYALPETAPNVIGARLEEIERKRKALRQRKSLKESTANTAGTDANTGTHTGL